MCGEEGFGGGRTPKESPQISPGNCSTMSLCIREQPQPLLGSLGNRGSIATVVCFRIICSVLHKHLECVCAPYNLKCFTMCFVVSLQDERLTVNSVVNCICVGGFVLFYK